MSLDSTGKILNHIVESGQKERVGQNNKNGPNNQALKFGQQIKGKYIPPSRFFKRVPTVDNIQPSLAKNDSTNKD